MNVKKLIITTLPVFLLLACEPEEPQTGLIFKKRIDTLEMESFKIPDSINTSLIIAAYYNADYHCQTLLVYNDILKNSAKKIDYMGKDSSSVDQLEFLKPNEFRSNRYLVDYVVYGQSVSMIAVRTHGETYLPASKEYRRTDRD